MRPGHGAGWAVLALALVACGGDPSGPGGNARLVIDVTGLPGGVPARITVTGPGSYSADVTGPRTLRGLKAGSYAVDARYVSDQGQLWQAGATTSTVTLSAGDSAAVTVNYSAGPVPTLDLSIAGTELLQVTQRDDGSVPMVEGEDALLRVLVVASEANTVQPNVRVRLYQGGKPVDTIDLVAPSASVPTSVSTPSLSTSWNATIPASLVQSGLEYDLTIDPDDRIPESDKGDNAWPGPGVRKGVTVQPVPPFQLRFVPVFQAATGQTGTIDNGNQGLFIARARQLLPLGSASTDVRVPYASTAPAAVPNDSNGAWSQILGEINALRTAERSNRNYMGIIKVSYTSGIAGLGYVGLGAAVSWDRSTSGPEVVAHELGHNFGRFHAPCGNPPGVDPSYPYAGGSIGTWGLDLTAMTLIDPAAYADLMGYCSPKWISDYNYLAILWNRVASPAAATGPAADGLLVWGRSGREGVVLEPAIALRAPASLPERSGPDLIEGVDAAGGRVFSLSFDATPVADLPDEAARQFAFVVPLGRAERERLRALRLTIRGLSTLRGVPAALMTSPGGTGGVSSRRVGAGVEVRWDPAYPLAVVRDRTSGAILSFARGGRVILPGDRERVAVQLSDGVTGGVIPPAP